VMASALLPSSATRRGGRGGERRFGRTGMGQSAVCFSCIHLAGHSPLSPHPHFPPVPLAAAPHVAHHFYDANAMLITFILMGRWFESLAKHRFVRWCTPLVIDLRRASPSRPAWEDGRSGLRAW